MVLNRPLISRSKVRPPARSPSQTLRAGQKIREFMTAQRDATLLATDRLPNQSIGFTL